MNSEGASLQEAQPSRKVESCHAWQQHWWGKGCAKCQRACSRGRRTVQLGVWRRQYWAALLWWQWARSVQLQREISSSDTKVLSANEKKPHFQPDDWISKQSLQKPWRGAGRGWTPFKSSLFPMMGSWRECLPHPGHTSNSQPNATPISTQLGWRQNKLGIMHRCPELEPDMAQVFVFRKGSFEPEARTNFHTRFWAPEPCNSHVLLRES